MSFGRRKRRYSYAEEVDKVIEESRKVRGMAGSGKEIGRAKTGEGIVKELGIA